MAHQATNSMMSTGEMLASLATQPFISFFNFLIRVGENSSRMQALNSLNETSDAELAARGTTRADAALQILGCHF